MKKIIFTLIIITLFSCNKAKESMQDAVTDAMENAIERKTGAEIDLPDTSEMENSGAFVNYKSATKTYLTEKEKMQATVIFQKDNEGLSIAFQMTGENGKSFVTTISHISEKFTLPLKAKFAIGNEYDGENPTANITFMEVNDTGMKSSEVPFEGEMIITKLSKDEVVFEINGKGSDAMNIDSPSNWNEIKGNGKLVHPIILSYGIDKNNILK
ncbi:MAG: hypothetical protein KYX68_04945 [Flavobacterium sp.]|nr:hypothetical protein [Flavobacterium sp.]